MRKVWGRDRTSVKLPGSREGESALALALRRGVLAAQRAPMRTLFQVSATPGCVAAEDVDAVCLALRA